MKIVEARNQRALPTLVQGKADIWLPRLLFIYSLCVSGWVVSNGLQVTMEDGYYYFKIAQNIAQGLGSSFDGIHPTNGYHPLWLLCLVGIFKIVRGEQAGLFAGIVLQAVFLAAATALVYSTARRLYSHLPAFLAALIWVLLTYRLGLSGLEFSLHALMICAAAYITLRWFGAEPPQSWFPYVALGFCMGLAVLARLDTIWLAFTLGLFLAWRQLSARSGSWSVFRLAGYAVPVLVLVSAYLAANRFYFGHILPVSSVVKREWSLDLLRQDPYYLSYGWFGAKIVQILRPLKIFHPAAVGVFGVGGLWTASLLLRIPDSLRDWSRQTSLLLSPFVIYAGLSYLSLSIVYHGALSFSSWYFVIQPWLISVTGGALGELLLRGWDRHPSAGKTKRISGLSRGILVMFCGVVLVSILASVLNWAKLERTQPGRLILYHAAQWANIHIPPEAVLGAWNAGTIGYLSGRQVINLDGVVNSWEYYERGRLDLCRYWDTENITYLLDVFQADRVLMSVSAYPAYAHCANRLILIWEDDHYNPAWSLKAYQVRSQQDILSNQTGKTTSIKSGECHED